MTDKVYSYVVFGMITGEHMIEDLRIRVPYRTAVPITEADYLNSRDLHRAVQQGYVKVTAQASIPTPLPAPGVLVAGLERRVEELQQALRSSEDSRRGLEAKIDSQGQQLEVILAAIQKIPERTVVVAGTGRAEPGSQVVGGAVPMFIPSNIDMGDGARINLGEAEQASDLAQAAQKLRELRKRQGQV